MNSSPKYNGQPDVNRGTGCACLQLFIIIAIILLYLGQGGWPDYILSMLP